MSFQIAANPEVAQHWLALHRKSEAHAHLAQRCTSEGRVELAQAEYTLAAQFELEAVSLVEGRPRTRGILAISAAALWHKGGHPDKAEQLARQELARSDVSVFARESLREFLPAAGKAAG
jgi:hypothetical protein